MLLVWQITYSKESLLNADEADAAMAKRFIIASLCDNMSGSFYGPIQRSNIKTFTDMHKKTNIKCRSGDVVRSNINPELIFRRALVLTLCRDDVTVKNYYLILLDRYRPLFFTTTEACEKVANLILPENWKKKSVHLLHFLHLIKIPRYL